MIGVDGHLKLTDFGLSKQLEEESPGSGEKRSTTRTICGTPEYIAPEVLQGKPYNQTIDWWTYGCLVYEMVHGRAPFRSLDMGSLVQLITRGKVSFDAEMCSKTLETMLRKFLVVDADSRLGSTKTGSGNTVREDPFFASMDWDALMLKEVPAPCALSEMFGDEGAKKSMPRAKRESRLQAEFQTWSGKDDTEDEELAMLRGPSPSPSSFNIALAEQPDEPSGNRMRRPSSQASSTYEENDGRPSPSNMVNAKMLEHNTKANAYDSGRAALSLELTRTGTIWAISQSLVRALGYNHLGKSMVLGKSMLESDSTLLEKAGLAKFSDAFDKAKELLDERLSGQEGGSTGRRTSRESAKSDGDSADSGSSPSGGEVAVASPGSAPSPSKVKSDLPDLTVWFQTASGGRVCMQITFEVVTLDQESSYQDSFGGPTGLVMLTMTDVTVAERNKELVATRYQLAYNDKAPDSDLIDFFSEYVQESTRSVPVPGTKRRSPTPTNELLAAGGAPGGSAGAAPDESGVPPGVRAYLARRRILIRAFPDLQFTMLEQTTQGGSVYTSWQYTGTHLGPYPDANIFEDDEGYQASVIHPSGARVHCHGISIDVFENGRIVDHSVFYDEAAVRAQLVLKAGSDSRGRNTRAILRRAHDTRAQNESGITVQLYLSVRKEHAHGGVCVGAMMRPVVSTAPRYSAHELTMMSTMEAYYASKATAQMGSFVTDGFCLCEAGIPHGSSPRGAKAEVAKRAEVGERSPASVILCSRAFARILNLKDRELLRTDLHALLEPTVRKTNPEVADRLASALTKQEPFHAVFEAHMSGEAASPRRSPRKAANGLSTASLPEDMQQVEATPATGDETPPGRVITIDAAPFTFERRLYWSVLISDLSDDLVLNNIDVNRRPPNDGTDQSPDKPSPQLGPKAGPGGKPAHGLLQRPQPFKSPIKRASRGQKLELADHFVHCVPSSWRWFGCKMLQNVMTAAMHASNAALSLSDLRGEDAPLVWIAEGFSRLNGWTRIEAIGRNCRFLQSDASDVGAIYEMRRAIAARVHTRVYLWNENIRGEGFWSMLSLSPGGDDGLKNPKEGALASSDDARARYVMGLQTQMTKADMRFIFEKVLAYRSYHWDAPEDVPQSPVSLPTPLTLGTAPQAPPVLWPLASSDAAASPAAASTGDVATALGAWEAEHIKLHGRKPTPGEVTAMVLDVYRKMETATTTAAVDVA